MSGSCSGGAAQASFRPRVAVITTGGTIASRPVEGRGVLATENGNTLLAAVPNLGEVAEVRPEEAFRQGSYLITSEQMLYLATRIRALGTDPAVDGIVVTHGTNTLEETAYLTDLMYSGAKPVVFTGAQRNASVEDSDGPRNLLDAVTVASSPLAGGLGGLVVMGGSLHGAREATKAHTSALDAFYSPGRGPLGEVEDGAVRIFHRRCRPDNLAHYVEDLPRVDLVKLAAGSDGTFLRASREVGAAGIVIEAFGKGNVNLSVLAEVKRCLSSGVVVLIVSRCPAGSVVPLYGDGGGHDLIEAGALMGGNLSGQKARILLMLALAAARRLPRPIVGELLDPHLRI